VGGGPWCPLAETDPSPNTAKTPQLSKVLGAATYGVNAFPVETHAEKKLPGVSIVGLPDNAVRESRGRVNAAIKSSFSTSRCGRSR